MSNLDVHLAGRVAAGNPIRIGMVGSGATARMIARHLMTPVPGIQICAIANRTLDNAHRLCSDLGIPKATIARGAGSIDSAVADGHIGITDDASDVCSASNLDVIVEVTGTMEFGAAVALDAIRHGKHVVLVNAELDATLGPILKTHADRASVVLTNTDGDEPGVAMTLLRYLRSIGLNTVAAGNLKGMIDRSRTPDTQREFASRHGMDAVKVASFADGTKLAMEATILANASGFRVGRRGMYGPACTHVKEIASLLPAQQLLDGGLVDYALGAEPHSGAFVVVYEPDKEKRKELAYFKMGDGPFFTFYTPYHLPHIQVASTIARAVIWHDATVSPLGKPVCEVTTAAKRDLKAGESLDGIGGFMTYGVIENSDVVHEEGLLPMGLSGGCRLVTDVLKGEAVRCSDVEFPTDRLSDRLWKEQNELFFPERKVTVTYHSI